LTTFAVFEFRKLQACFNI